MAPRQFNRYLLALFLFEQLILGLGGVGAIHFCVGGGGGYCFRGYKCFL